MGALSLAGFVAGGFLGSRVAPMLLSEGSRSPYAPLFALMGALLVGGILAAALEVLGFRLRGRLGQGLGALDGIGGAVLVGAIGLGLVRLAGAVALHTPGARQLREPIQRSAILQQLNAALPPSGPLLKTLARFDPFPGIRGPSEVAPPNRRSPTTPRCAPPARAWSACWAPPAGLACRAAAGWRETAWW